MEEMFAVYERNTSEIGKKEAKEILHSKREKGRRRKQSETMSKPQP
jgi:hypothetical protein